jgi:hypothetical protein
MFACDVGLPAVAGATPRLNVTDCDETGFPHVFIMKAKRFVIISMVLKGVQDPTVLLHISVLNAKRQAIHKDKME